MSTKVKTAPPQAQAQVIHAQFKQAFNLTVALRHACNTDSKCLPYSNLVELLYPLSEQLSNLDVVCVHTRWSGMANRMKRYSNVLVELLRGNQADVPPSDLTALLGPLLADLKLVKLAYAKMTSAHKAANSKPKDANQNDDEGKLADLLPVQEPPIRDGLVITAPQENILELIKASLADKPDDIWAKYQACLPANLTPEEVKIAHDSFMAVFKEYFI